MASEMINQVLEAEKDAKEKELFAKNKAADIIKAAQDDAKSILESAMVSASNEKEQIIQKAQEKADQIFANAQDEAGAQSRELHKQVQEKLSASIDAVVKHVIPQTL
ncbi:MAG: V-type ATPase subunit subunit G family protein [Acutalibacteraceae bacterium]|jgi:vacuolar-type H+-ATPase subunit H|nr:hypothetical protein [Clostridiales bacterium]